MPKPPLRLGLLRELGKVYDSLAEQHYGEVKAIGNRIPIGGNVWMDLFFQMEGVRGVIEALRHGATLASAIEQGKESSTYAVKQWNKRREYQVHRWEKTTHSWLENLARRLNVNS